jgi:1-aminocyclopropane-1-carboxylate deaminase/D-cysteine desulfhydrase-like pyridoxal-dependent ACC family enzyme
MGVHAITARDLGDRLAAEPRVPLACLPTPLDACPRLSESLDGVQVLVKRDDLTGLAFGGNKTRKLEFLLTESVASGVDVIVTGAAKQSNFCRQTAAAAARLGMEAVLLLIGDPRAERQGNLLVDDLVGADVRLHPYTSWTELHEAIRATAAHLREHGRRARALTGFEPVGALAYVECALELAQQCRERDVHPDVVVVSSATGTQAGLEVGFRALGLDTHVVGVSPLPDLEGYPTIAARLAEVGNWLCERLELSWRLAPEDVDNTTAYVGQGYAVLGSDARAALELFARTEGLILDPVYTAKAAAGLVDMCRDGRIAPGGTVVFVHTGGTPALFAYASELSAAAHTAEAP